MGLCKEKGKVITIHGTNEDTPDESNIIKILDIEWSIVVVVMNLYSE